MNQETLKVIGDMASYTLVLGAIVKVLPPLAALASILWIGFQFYHSEPMKQWRHNRKMKHDSNTIT